MPAIILYHVGYIHVWIGPLVTTQIVLIQQVLKSPLHAVLVVVYQRVGGE